MCLLNYYIFLWTDILAIKSMECVVSSVFFVMLWYGKLFSVRSNWKTEMSAKNRRKRRSNLEAYSDILFPSHLNIFSVKFSRFRRGFKQFFRCCPFIHLGPETLTRREVLTSRYSCSGSPDHHRIIRNGKSTQYMIH